MLWNGIGVNLPQSVRFRMSLQCSLCWQHVALVVDWLGECCFMPLGMCIVDHQACAHFSSRGMGKGDSASPPCTLRLRCAAIVKNRRCVECSTCDEQVSDSLCSDGSMF